MDVLIVFKNISVDNNATQSCGIMPDYGMQAFCIVWETSVW